jgi:serine/threonine-protein kinase HipA
MSRCPITYEELPVGSSYSIKGLRQLNRKLTGLLDLPFSAEEQRQEALRCAGKMSVQGLQLKLSAVLNLGDQCSEERFFHSLSGTRICT